ncbi:MAG TPA: glycosyltransferase family 9 protein, partial [Ktedonobacteraceae bacterium]|nr:glycosyltransferase family 9 protein [Ktedonobacteraceae bacterium]
LRYLEVVSLVDAQPVGLEPHLEVIQEDLDEAQRVVDTEWPSDALIALHPGAGDPRRRWPPEKFAAVGDALAAAGAKVVVIGTSGERHLAEAVINTMKAPAQNICGCISLGGLAGLFSRCRVVVSNDSGPLHLAGAVGAATVGIYWCFNLINAGPLTRARHRSASSWRLECPICGVNCLTSSCNHHDSFVADIPVEEVTEPALDLFYNQYTNGLPSANTTLQ